MQTSFIIFEIALKKSVKSQVNHLVPTMRRNSAQSCFSRQCTAPVAAEVTNHIRMQHLLIIFLSTTLPISIAQVEQRYPYNLFQDIRLQERFCSEFKAFDYFCVPYYQCSKQNLIITNGVGLFDPRGSGEPDCDAGSVPIFQNKIVKNKIQFRTMKLP